MSDVPTRDAQFYAALDAMAQRVGAKAEDLLLVWSSESGLRTDLAGAARTFSTLMKYSAVPTYMDDDTWERLPTMSAAEQLPYVEAAIYAPAHKIVGRPFRTTFETYLANAAPGLLRSDGQYNPETVMYEGRNYPDNWPMDNAPAGQLAAKADGIVIRSPRGTYDYAKTLVDRRILKGYVSLGDLRNFGKRLLQGSEIFTTALGYLRNVRDNQRAGLAPNVDPPMSGFLTWKPSDAVGAAPAPSYTPDFDAFPVGAPIDTRVASPTKARRDMPASGNVASRGLELWPVAIGGGIAAIAAWWVSRK